MNDYVDTIKQEALEKIRPVFTDLTSFLKSGNYLVKPNKNNEEKPSIINFVDQRHCVNYYIPDQKIPEFLNLLDKCRQDKLPIGFSEIQYPIINREQINKGEESDPIRLHKSGICIDLDIYQNIPTRIWVKDNLTIIADIIRCLLKDSTTELPKEYKLIVLSRLEISKIEENKYRDGIHILIPEIQTTKYHKKWLMNNLQQEKDFIEIFSKTGFTTSNVVDDKTASNPILLYGCSRPMKNPYEISTVFNIIERRSAQVSVDDEFLKQNSNLTQELSLIYPGKILNKQNVELKPNIIPTESYEVKISDEYHIQSDNVDVVDDSKYYVVSKLIDIISVDFSADNSKWEPIIFALANLNLTSSSDYKSLAYKFSAKCPELFNQQSKKRIDGIFEYAKNSNSNYGRYSIGTIYRAAKLSNPVEYNSIRKNIPTHMLLQMTKKTKGTITDYDASKILYSLFSNKFYYDPQNKIWYQYITKLQKGMENGSLFKFIECDTPEILTKCITEKLPDLVDNILCYYKKLKDTTQDNDTIKWLQKMTSALENSRDKLKDTGKVDKIIKACKITFTYHNFRDYLNKDMDIIGINDGIIELGNKCIHIPCKHNYKISFFSKVNYAIYSDLEKNMKYLMDKWNSCFPEEDVRKYYLYYFGDCLSGRDPEPKVHIWYGPGKNSKSTWMSLMSYILGNKYASKLNIKFWTSPMGEGNSHTEHLMETIHSRWCYSSESEAGDKLYAGNMKYLLSGEDATVRGIYEKKKTVRFHVRPMIGTNHLFNLEGSMDYGTLRRLAVYRMKRRFVNHVEYINDLLCDPDFIKNKIKDPNIQTAWLHILLNAYEDLQMTYGGNLENVHCPTIDMETKQYIEGQDTISCFINYKLVPEKGSKLKLNEIIQKYMDWYIGKFNKSRDFTSKTGFHRDGFLSSSICNSFIKIGDEYMLFDYKFAEENASEQQVENKTSENSTPNPNVQK